MEEKQEEIKQTDKTPAQEPVAPVAEEATVEPAPSAPAEVPTGPAEAGEPAGEVAPEAADVSKPKDEEPTSRPTE